MVPYGAAVDLTNSDTTTTGTTYGRRAGDITVTVTTNPTYWVKVVPPVPEPVLSDHAAASHEAHAAMVAGSRARSTPAAAHARHGFQQMARLPCYRGTRAR